MRSFQVPQVSHNECVRVQRVFCVEETWPYRGLESAMQSLSLPAASFSQGTGSIESISTGSYQVILKKSHFFLVTSQKKMKILT